MLSFVEMTHAELRHTIQVIATSFAHAAFMRIVPSTADAAACEWAECHWRRFENRAVDFLTLLEARRERRV